MLNEEKNKGIQDYLRKLSPTAATEYSLWKATKKLKQPQRVFLPIRREDGSWARNEMEKVSVLAIHLANVFKPNLREIEPKEEEEIHSALNKTCNLSP